jgi:hypothetical protein
VTPIRKTKNKRIDRRKTRGGWWDAKIKYIYKRFKKKKKKNKYKKNETYCIMSKRM